MDELKKIINGKITSGRFFFTSDEHYYHKNIIKFCNRPFSSKEEMNEEMIRRHNEVVTEHDTTIHAGDFAFVKSIKDAYKIIHKLNGKHIFLRGSHDHWMDSTKYFHEILEKRLEDQLVVVCHYAMRVWAASHYNSWHLYGHSHGRLQPEGKSMDIGVDTNNFYPYSFEQIKEIMKDKPDNFDLIKK